MSEKKNTRILKNVKHLSIGPPTDFEHRHHMSYNATDSWFRGVPAQWRTNLAKSAQFYNLSNDNFKYNSNEFNRVDEKSIDHIKYMRVGSWANSDTPLCDISSSVSDFNCDKIIRADPGPVFVNVALKYNWGSSRIFYGYRKDEKALLSLKFVSLSANTLAQDLKSELTFHIDHSHENIVQFIEAYIWESCCLLVFVEEEDITLHELINSIDRLKSSNKIFAHANLAYITHSILKGLQYIHSNNYSHRDIKSDNILISSNGKIKISDFGICKKSSKPFISTDISGTPYWMAPEIANRQLQYLEVDIWSIGCLVIEMIKGTPPLSMYSPDEAIKKLQTLEVIQIFPTEIHPKFSSFARPFLDCCLVIKRNNRASASQLLIHPFLMARSTPQDLIDLIKSGTALL